MTLSREQFSGLYQKGLSPEQIIKFEGGYVPEVKKNIFQKGAGAVAGGFNNTVDFVKDTHAQNVKDVSRNITPVEKTYSETDDTALTEGPGILGRVMNTMDKMRMQFGATKGLADFATRPRSDTYNQYQDIRGQYPEGRMSLEDSGKMGRELRSKGLQNAGFRAAGDNLARGASIAALPLGVAGDALHHVFKTAKAGIGGLMPGSAGERGARVDRAFMDDRSVGDIAFESGEKMTQQRVDQLLAEGVDPEKIPNIVAREQYLRKFAGDVGEFMVAPAALGKFSRSDTAKRLGRSAKHLKGRFKRPDVVDTKGIGLDVPQVKGTRSYKFKGQDQRELFSPKHVETMGKKPGAPVVEAPKLPMKETPQGQQVMPFGKVSQAEQGQQVLDFGSKKITIKVPKEQGDMRFMRRGIKDGIKSPSETPAPKTPKIFKAKADIAPSFKTGNEAPLLDYLNKHFTGHQVANMSAAERLRFGKMSSYQLRDEIARIKDVRIPGKTASPKAKSPFGKKLEGQALEGEQVPLHPAAEGRAVEKGRNILKNKKGAANASESKFNLADDLDDVDELDGVLKKDNILGNNRGSVNASKHQIKKWKNELKRWEEQSGEYAEQQAAQYRQLLDNAKRAVPKLSSLRNRSGQAGPDKSKAAPKIFRKKYNRRSRSLGKMAKDTKSQHYGVIQGEGKPLADGTRTLKLSGGSYGDEIVEVPRSQLTISQLNPKKSGLAEPRPSRTIPVSDAEPKFNKVEVFKAKPKVTDPKVALKAKHEALQKEIIELTKTNPKGKDRIVLGAKRQEYRKIGNELRLTDAERNAATKIGRKELAKPKTTNPLDEFDDYIDDGEDIGSILKNERGELRFGGDKKKIREAKAVAIRIVTKAEAKKISTDEYITKFTNMTKQQKRDMAPFIKDASRRIGNIDVARLEKQGVISSKEAEIMERAGKYVGKQKTTVSRAQRGQSVDPKTFEMATKIAGMEEGSAAAISDIPIVSAQQKIQKFISNPEKGLSSLVDDIEGHMMEYNQLGKFFGRGLQARKNPIAVNDMIKSLNKLKGSTRGPDEIRLNEIIADLKASKAGAFRQGYDIFHEIAINNMLSAAITWSRNVSGTAKSGGMMVGDKIASAVASSILPEGATAGTKSYMREIIPMVKGMIQSAPSSMKNGMRYFLYEDTHGVVKHLSKKIAKLRSARSKIITERASKGIKVSAKQHSAEIAEQHAKIKAIVKDIKRIYMQESASRLEEVLPTGRRALRGARDVATGELTAPGKVVDAVGYAANTPSRALVAQDKAFAGMYYGGQSLASKTRKAIKMKIPLKYVTSESRAADKIAQLRKTILNSDNPKVIAKARQQIKWYKDLKLNRVEEEAVKDAALYYVFREQLPKQMQKFQEVIVNTPVVNTTFPFLKSNYNFIKYSLDHSPLGVFGLKVKGKKAIDANQLGKVIAGTAFWSYTYDRIKKSGGEIYGASTTKEERNLKLQTGRKDARIEWKDKNGNVTKQYEFGNLAPETQPMLYLAAIDEYARDKKKGRPDGENLRDQANKFVMGILQESPYSSLKQTVAAFDNATTSYDAYGSEDKQAGTASGLQKFGRQWLAGKVVPNLLAEISKEGKFFGVKIKEPDRNVYEARSAWEAIKAKLPVDAWKKDLLRRADWSGKNIERLEQISPFNPKFYQEGRKIVNDSVYDALFQLKVYPREPSKTTSLGEYKGIYLTDDEREAMKKKTGPKLYNTLKKIVENPKFKAKGLSNLQRQKILKDAISSFNRFGYAYAKVGAFKRMQSTEEGRKALEWKKSKGLSTTPSIFRNKN